MAGDIALLRQELEAPGQQRYLECVDFFAERIDFSFVRWQKDGHEVLRVLYEVAWVRAIVPHCSCMETNSDMLIRQTEKRVSEAPTKLYD